MFFDRKAAFWVTSTLLVCMFVIFVILAVLVTPEPKLDYSNIDAGSNTEYLVDAVRDLNNMVWWMTVGFIMLPIMLLLLFLAIYFLFTAKDDGQPKAAAALPVSPGTKDAGSKDSKGASEARTSAGSKTETLDPSDALDLRYARGEVTREQYLDMQRELKKARL